MNKSAGGVLARLANAGWIGAAAVTAAALVWAWLGGWQLNVIESASMAPTLQRNSLAVIAPSAPGAVREGDVIAFRDRSRNGVRVIHRVANATEQNGVRFFETKGDANKSADTWLVPEGDVEGRLIFRARHLGAAVHGLSTPVGPALLVGVPVLALVIGEIRHRRTAPRWAAYVCPTCGTGRAALGRRSDVDAEQVAEAGLVGGVVLDRAERDPVVVGDGVPTRGDLGPAPRARVPQLG